MLNFFKKSTPDSSQNDLPKWGLSKTRQLFSHLFNREKISPELFENLEEQLLLADVGIMATQELLMKLRHITQEKKMSQMTELRTALMALLEERLSPLETAIQITRQQPCVIMVVGVNGAGKTTSIGKLAYFYRQQNKSVLIAAGDTFRAAAVDQLQVWGERNDVPVIVGGEKSSSASVIFDAVHAAQSRKIDVVLADTAGRLTTQATLMDELIKVKRSIAKSYPGAPHEILLVLDANTGQNTLSQLKIFNELLGITGLFLTKIDGTAKGGMVIAISQQYKIPIRFLGVGEKLEDIFPFKAKHFVEALFDDSI